MSGELTQLINRVENWAQAKGILDKATPEKQAEKTLEEAKELLEAILFDDAEGIIDGIGDVLVTIIIQAKMQGLPIEECLEHSLTIIEKRTGRMIDGQFVKDK